MRLFDQIASKSKIKPAIPSNLASAIRKASIDHIVAGKSSKHLQPPSSPKQTAGSPIMTFDKASLAQSSEKFSAMLAKQPIDGTL